MLQFQLICVPKKINLLSFICREDDGPYIAYVSQQNLLKDDSQEPCLHPQIDVMFNNVEGDI